MKLSEIINIKIEWQITVVSVIALILVTSYFYDKNEKLQNEIYINNLIKESPTLSYTWLSNYKLLAFYPIDMPTRDRILNLRSKYEIKNVSGGDLENVHLYFYISIDPNTFHSPYNISKGIQLFSKDFNTLKNNTSISFDVLDAIKKRGVDLSILFPGESAIYNSMAEYFKGRSENFGPPFPLDPKKDGSPPYIPVNIKGIFLNGRLQFLYKGVTYIHVLAGSIGYGFSDPSDSKQTKGMYVQDCFFKQGWSQIRFPSKEMVIVIPQHTYNGYDYIDSIKGHVNILWGDKAGNFNSYDSWFNEYDGLYYYNKYSSSHNMPYPPYNK